MTEVLLLYILLFSASVTSFRSLLISMYICNCMNSTALQVYSFKRLDGLRGIFYRILISTSKQKKKIDNLKIYNLI